MTPIQKRKGILTGLFCLIILLVILPSCTHDPVGIEDLDIVCFKTQVMPILATCGTARCHDGTQEGFLATDYTSIMRSVKAGDPKNSSLYKAITNINSENFMPPTGPLSLADRTIIEVWIAQGADSTMCESDTVVAKACSDSTYFEEEILPLFITSCAYPNDVGNCHDGIPQGGEEDPYALNSYASIRPHVRPKNLNGSSVYQAVTGQEEEFMPPQPFAPLTNAEIELLGKWINEGTINNSCAEAGCADTLLTPIVYNGKISKIIETNCKNCHKTGNLGGGINLESYLLVKHQAETVKTGTIDNYLVGTIRHVNGYIAMPYKSAPISECSIRKIELWIKDGMLEN